MNNLRNEQGAALILVIISMVVLMLLGGTFLTVTLAGSLQSNKTENNTEAYFLAEGAVETALAGLNYEEEDVKEKFTWPLEWVGKEGISNEWPEDLEFSEAGKEYDFRYDDTTEDNVRTIRIRGYAENGSEQQTAQVEFTITTNSISDFAGNSAVVQLGGASISFGNNASVDGDIMYHEDYYPYMGEHLDGEHDLIEHNQVITAEEATNIFPLPSESELRAEYGEPESSFEHDRNNQPPLERNIFTTGDINITGNNSTVNGDIVSLSGDITVVNGSTINGDIIAIGGSITLDNNAIVNGNAICAEDFGIWNNSTINGYILSHGNVSVNNNGNEVYTIIAIGTVDIDQNNYVNGTIIGFDDIDIGMSTLFYNEGHARLFLDFVNEFIEDNTYSEVIVSPPTWSPN